MDRQLPLPLPVSDSTLLDCGIYLELRIVAPDKNVYEQTIMIPRPSVKGMSLSKVGTYLQREVYELLRGTYAQSLAQRDSIGQLETTQ